MAAGIMTRFVRLIENGVDFMNRNQSEWIRLVGYITMVIDHIGVFLFPEVALFRVIGRIAFPCFLYGVVEGVEHTSNSINYAKRLTYMGIVSIVAWGRYFPINIGFTLALVVLGLAALRKKNYFLVFLIGILSVFVEYSIYAYLLGFILYGWRQGLMSNQQSLLVTIFIHILFLPISGFSQMFALLFILVYFFTKNIKQKAPAFPRWFGYSFYPIHVFVLRIVGALLGVSV